MCTYIIDPQAQLPNVPSEPVEQISAEDLPEVPTEEPGGTIQFCYYSNSTILLTTYLSCHTEREKQAQKREAVPA